MNVDFEHLREFYARGASVREIFNLGVRYRAEGRKPIDLSIGNPDVKPPPAYYRALREVVKECEHSSENLHRYMPNAGFPEVRRRVAAELAVELDVPFEPRHVMITAGAANALDIVIATLLWRREQEPGVAGKAGEAGEQRDTTPEALLVAPYFPEYETLIRGQHARCRAVAATADYRLDLEAIEAAIGPATRLLVLNSPNNPTGAVYTAEELSALADLLIRKRDELGTAVVVLEDSPYHRIVFGEHQFAPMVKHYPYTVFVSSLSKSLGLAGERIGYLAAHPQLAAGEESSAVFSAALSAALRMRVVNAPALQQRVLARIGIGPHVDPREYERRAVALGQILAPLGFRFAYPQGGFYLFAEIPERFQDENEFRAVMHAGEDPLLYVPGTVFGGEAYRRSVRLSACVPEAEIQRAGAKLSSALA